MDTASRLGKEVKRTKARPVLDLGGALCMSVDFVDLLGWQIRLLPERPGAEGGQRPSRSTEASGAGPEHDVVMREDVRRRRHGGRSIPIRRVHLDELQSRHVHRAIL